MKKNFSSRSVRHCLSVRQWLFILWFCSGVSFAQNVTVTGALTGNGSYADLASAFAAINGGSQTSANITVDIIGNTTETVSAVLNAGAWSSLVVQPSGGVARAVSGAIAGALVDLNGASNVQINGLNSGGNSLQFSNTDLGNSATTLRLWNGASGNVVSNSTFLGASASITQGVISFSTTTGTGNNNNRITANNIGAASTGFPANGLYSAGTSTAANTSNTVSANNVFDFFQPAVATAGILLDANNEGWSISSNRLYLTAVRTYTVANTLRGISINSGNTHTITNNIIGYANSAGTGVSAMTSTAALRYIGIQLAMGTSSFATVQGNTVTAINFTTASTAATANGALCGLHITSGNLNANANVFGGASGTDLLYGYITASGGMVVGFALATTGSVSVTNNYLGGFTAVGSSAAVGSAISGINNSAVASTLAITGNTIGNPTSNNMKAGVSGITTAATNMSGMNLSSTSTNTILISGNTVQNYVAYGSGSGYVRAVWTAAGGGATTTYSIVSNTLMNLTSFGAATGISNGQTGIVGVNLSSGVNGVVASNTIANLALMNTGAIANIAAGITHGNATSTRIRNNVIYNITNASTNASSTAPATAGGIIIRSGTTDMHIHNNMISLGSGNSDNTAYIGIQGNHGSTPDPTVAVYYNTINIMGTVASGTNPSFGIHRGDLTATTRSQTWEVRNNLVTNSRSGGTGNHYAIGNGYNNSASSSTGWSSNYNVLNSSASTIGHWSGAQTFSGWKTASGGDGNSFSGIPVTYVNTVSNLHLNFGTTPTLIESGGIVLAGFGTDIDNQVRPGPSGSTLGGALAPDIGADEFDGAVQTCTTASGGVLSSSSGTACAGQVLAVSSASASTGIGTTYQWMVATSPGGPYSNVTGGSGATTTSYTSAPLPSGTYYIVLRTICPAVSMTATSNEGTLTVNAIPSASISPASASVCSGNSLTLAGSSNSGTSYLWRGAGGFTSTAQTLTLTNTQLYHSGTFSLQSFLAGCASTMALVNVTVQAAPGPVTVTPSSTLICSTNTATIISGGGKRPAVFSFTPQTNMNTLTTYPSVYSVYYGGQKVQFLVLASELSAAGIGAGSLTALQFPVVSLGSNWGTSLLSLQNFQVSIGHTNLSSTGATFESGLTVVSTAGNYTPTVGYNNIHVFNTPFVWNGTSNIVVETVFSNNITGTTNDGVIQYYSPTSFESTMHYRADGQTFATIAAATTTNNQTGINGMRPDFRLYGQAQTPFSWSPSTGLSSTTAQTVQANPASSTVYSVSATNAGCTSSNTVAVNVTPLPVLSVTQSADSVCLGDSVYFDASGASTYTWTSPTVISSSLAVAPAASTIYTVSSAAAPCPVVSTTAGVIVNPLPTVVISPASPTVCASSLVSFTATGAGFYFWSTSSFDDTTNIIATTNTVIYVLGINGHGCVNIDSTFILVNPLPTVMAQASSASVCVNNTVALAASGASTYTWTSGGNGPSTISTITATGVNNFTVDAHDSNGCPGSAVTSVFGFSLPLVVATPSAVIICEGESTVLMASGADSYEWLPGTGTGPQNTVNPVASTVYTVTGTDNNLCRNTATISLIVDACTGVKAGSLSAAIRIFPNPSDGQFSVVMPLSGSKAVIVTNGSGQVVMKKETQENEAIIDLRNMAKGLYFVEISHEGASARYRMIVD